MITLGLVGLVASIFNGLNARKTAEKLLVKTGDSEYVSTAEYSLIDNLRIIAFFAVLISCSILKMGKTSFRVSFVLKPDFTAMVYKKSKMRIAFIAFLAYAIRIYAIEAERIVNKQFEDKKHHHSRKLSEIDTKYYNIEAFKVGPECPYFNRGHSEAKLDKQNNEIKGIYGPWGEYYKKV